MHTLILQSGTLAKRASYRSARIKCYPGGHVCGLFMPEHPLHGLSFDVVGTVMSLVDLWPDAGRLPSYMRAMVQRRA